MPATVKYKSYATQMWVCGGDAFLCQITLGTCFVFKVTRRRQINTGQDAEIQLLYTPRTSCRLPLRWAPMRRVL